MVGGSDILGCGAFLLPPAVMHMCSCMHTRAHTCLGAQAALHSMSPGQL